MRPKVSPSNQHRNKRRNQNQLPGFYPSLGLSVVYLSVLIVLPLGYLFFNVFTQSWADFMQTAFNDRARAAYRLTLLCALFATLLNMIFGLLLAWVLTRYQFYGKRFIDALVDLPFALPTAVAGIALVTLYDVTGWLGKPLAAIDISVAYTMLGITLAMMFTSIPFCIRNIQPVLAGADPDIESVAKTLGASDLQVFRHIIFPQIQKPWLLGAALSFSRSIGEFGAVVFIAGNLPFKTEIASLLIMIRLDEYDDQAASNIAFLLLALSVVVLLLTQFYEQVDRMKTR